MEPYQFPELSWNRGSTLSTCVEHGLHLRANNRLLIPDYQRPLVWTENQKVRFMESLILGLPIGEYTLHQNDYHVFELIDGQQRWNAIFDYHDDKFPVFGLRYSELNITTKQVLLMMQFAHRTLVNLTLEQRIEAYNRLAYGGTPHTPLEESN